MMMIITPKRGKVINFPADEMFLEFTSDPVCSHDYSFPKTKRRGFFKAKLYC